MCGNLDPDYVADPLTVDIDRLSNRHVTGRNPSCRYVDIAIPTWVRSVVTVALTVTDSGLRETGHTFRVEHPVFGSITRKQLQ